MSTYGPPTRTVGEVMTAVKRKFGDESGVQLENTDIVAWINDAQDLIVAKNKILKAKSSTAVVPGQASYTFPSTNIHQIESVLLDGRRITNMAVSQAEETISEMDPEGVEEGFPQFWYEWAGELTFWPKPVDEGTILLRYTARPERVTNDPAALLGVPDSYYQDVINYVLAQAYEMDENEGMMTAKGQQFDNSLAARGEEERTAAHMTYETITVIDD